MTDTKEQILEAAMKLIGKTGISDLTIREIAKNSNVNVAAINYHFGSKENLIKAAMGNFIEQLFARLTELARTAAPAEERISSMLHYHAECFSEFPGFLKSLVFFKVTDDPDFLSFSMKFKRGLELYLEVFDEVSTSSVTAQNKKVEMIHAISSISYPVVFSDMINNLFELDYTDVSQREEYVDSVCYSIIKTLSGKGENNA